MQQGSIVVVKIGATSKQLNKSIAPKIKWKPIDDEKTPYTIRNIAECPIRKYPCATFEEGIIGYNDCGQEYALGLKHLIEIMPPDTIVQELLEEQPETLLITH